MLILTFASWFFFERTLSIHSIFTWRREFFYWMAVLWTFALGTSTGDSMSEDGGLGYWRTLLMIFGICFGFYVIHLVLKRVLKASYPEWIPILLFWLAYILTRPLGGSIGDFLASDRWPQYDPTNCNPVGTTSDVVGCSDPDVFCITSCASYPIVTTSGNLRMLAATTTAAPKATTAPVTTAAPTTSADDSLPASMTCPDPTLTCPYGYNTCNDLEATCYTPLACDNCWGLEGISQTNIAFGVAVVVFVTFLALTRYDVILGEENAESIPIQELPSNIIE